MTWAMYTSKVFLGLSPLICYSASNWLMVWIALEINLICFISICFDNNSKSTNSMMKYFMVQVVSSLTMAYFMILDSFLMIQPNLFISLSMTMKLGLFPFFSWLASVSEGMNWISFFIFSSWQKIIPLQIMSSYPWFLQGILIMSSLVGTMLLFNSSSLRKLLVYSSLPNMSWMLIFMEENSSYWEMYLLIYSIILAMIMNIFFNFKINSLAQITFLPTFLKFTLLSLLLSLGGFPPFLGFGNKLLACSYIYANNILPLGFLMLSSVISCFLYIRSLTPMINFSLISVKSNHFSMNKTLYFNTLNMTGLPMIISLTKI